MQDHLRFISASIEENSWFIDVKDMSYFTKVVNQNTAFISSIQLLSMAFSKREQQLKAFISKDTISGSLVGIALNRNFCCREKLNKIITRIKSSGLLEKYIDNGCFKMWLSNENNSEGVNFNQGPLSLEEISGVFLMLLSGYVISFITLLIEILFYKYNVNYYVKKMGLLIFFNI